MHLLQITIEMTISEQGKEASAFYTDKAQQGCVEPALTNPIPEPSGLYVAVMLSRGP